MQLCSSFFFNIYRLRYNFYQPIYNKNNKYYIFSDIYWKVNYDRFHLDFRDEVMIKAVTRRIDDNGQYILIILYNNINITVRRFICLFFLYYFFIQ